MENFAGLSLAVFWPFLAAGLVLLTGRVNRTASTYFVVFAVVMELFFILSFIPHFNPDRPLEFHSQLFFALPIHFRFDGFRMVFTIITTFMWAMTGIFSVDYFKDHGRNLTRYFFFYLLTLGATVGVMLSGNLWTTFLFFEIMTFVSYFLVIHDETQPAITSANAYLAVGVFGGLAILLGLFLIASALGTTQIDLLAQAVASYQGDGWLLYLASLLMAVGFGGKAGMYPLHFWLPMAHPVAPAPASALLSGILTKTGIFGLLVIAGNLLLHDLAWGWIMLIFGTLTMVWGGFLAMFSIDLKKTLALSSVSQIGFIIVGIGMQGILQDHNAIAVRGTLLHMVNHALLKLLLFMAAGVVFRHLHTLDLNSLRGFGRNKPLLKTVFAIAGLSLMSLPLFSGYISKTLLHESIVEYIWSLSEYNAEAFIFQVVESLFTLTGGFTVAYVLKLFIAIFVEDHPSRQAEYDSQYPDLSDLELISLVIPAGIVLVLGLLPALMDRLADLTEAFVHGPGLDHGVHYFAWANLKGSLASVTIGLILYTCLVRNLLMEENPEGQRIYVARSAGFIHVFFQRLGRRFTTWLFNGLAWLTNLISVIPSWIISEAFHFYLWIDTRYIKGILPRGQTYLDKDERNQEAPNLDRLLTSSLSFGLLQFFLALVIILILVLAIHARA